MKKAVLVLLVICISAVLYGAAVPEQLTEEQAKAEVGSLIKAADEIIGIFSYGLPYEYGEEYKECEKFPYLPVKSEKYKSVADIKKAVEKVMTKSAAAGIFYDSYLLFYPQYKDYKGKLYSCINSFIAEKYPYIVWDTKTLKIVSQENGRATVKMRTFNPAAAEKEEQFGDSYLDIEWENSGWRLASSPLCSTTAPDIKPKNLQRFLEGYISKANSAFDNPGKGVKVVWNTAKAEIHFAGEDWIAVKCPFKGTGKNKNTYSALLYFEYQKNKWNLVGSTGTLPEKYGNIVPDFFAANENDGDTPAAVMLKDYGAKLEYYCEDGEVLPLFFEQIAREEFTGQYDMFLEGDYCYTLIPAEKDTKIEIFSLKKSGEADRNEMTSVGKPVILFTGKAYSPTHEIKITTADGKELKFRISGKADDLPDGILYRFNKSAG